MKVVKNSGYEGFELPNWVYAELGVNCVDEIKRNDKRLVQIVETAYANDDSCEWEWDGGSPDLEIIEIPDETTDFIISDYDGIETIYYVINGKIRSA